MSKGCKRTEIPFEFEVSVNYLQQRQRYYQSYRDLSKEIGLSVNTLAKMIKNENVSMKSWQKILKWKNKKQEEFKRKNPNL